MRLQPLHRLEWVSRDKLFANGYNPNHVASPEMKLLKRSIMETGWTQPIVALTSGQIVDGFHRWTCAADPKIAGLTDGLVPVVYIDVDDAHAMMATVRHNRARGQHGIMPMASITGALKEKGLDQSQIMDGLGMDREEVERLLDETPMPQRVASGRKMGAAWKAG